MLEPDPESLLVFLAVHVVGHRFERPQWTENVGPRSHCGQDRPRVVEVGTGSGAIALTIAAE
jgi:methylase of polypeptide subunit release factors